MNSRATRTADSKPARNNTRLGQKRPAVLSLAESTKRTEDSVPPLVSAPPMYRRAQATPCPVTPMTPDLDLDDGNKSPGSSKLSSSSSTFTFSLLSPTIPHHGCGFSFTACPSSPLLDDSTVYAFPSRKRPTLTSFPMRSRRLSTDHSELSIVFDSPLSEDPLREGLQSPSDDRKYFHVQFLQDDPPFPKTPDC